MTADGKIGKREIQTKLKQHAKDLFARWGLPVDQYHWTAGQNPDRVTWQVVGTYTNGEQVMLTEIWIGDLGEVLQEGTSYGILTL